MDDVTWEDQQKINEYSKLNARLGGFETEVQRLRARKDDYEELETELGLADEDDEFMFQVGDAFMLLRQVEILERIEIDEVDINVKIDELLAKEELTTKHMEVLKGELYAKFGRESINLERM